MQKIGDTTKTADSNGEFTDGDPQKQIPCTWIMAAWLTTLQREVIKVVQEGGLTLNPKDDTQLYQAIEALMGAKVEGVVKSVNTHNPDTHGNVTLPDASTTGKGLAQYSSATNSASETLAATPKAVKAAYDLAAAALPKTGGTLTGSLTTPYVASTPNVMPEGAGAYADQLNHKAPFYQPSWEWPVTSGGIFVPIAKGVSTRKGQGYPTAVTYGYLIPGTNEFAHPTIHVGGDNNFECVWDFNPSTGNLTSSKAGEFATQSWVTQNLGQVSVSGNQWWVKINLNGATLIFQGGRAVGSVADDGITERVGLNISVPNRLLHVSITVKNFAQGYETTWTPQVGDLSNERDGFNWLHGTQERDMYWFAVGY